VDRVKIVATVGPASLRPGILRKMIRAGVDAVRINASHTSPESLAGLVETIRRASREAGGDVPVILDLQGPKHRIGEMPRPLELREGDEVFLTPSGGEGRISVPAKLIDRYFRKGGEVFLHDGFIRLRVLSVRRREARARVELGGRLKSRAGLNFPGAPMTGRVPTARDIGFIEAGLAAGADVFALSFVLSPNDLKRCRRYSGDVPIIAKIERPEAVEAIDEIARASAGILVARGDLAVEMAPEELPAIQKKLVSAANRARKPVIVATEMLASMVHNPRPTRAELNDVGNAVLDGADAVMLSDETAIGDHPVLTVEYMSRILSSVERSLLRYDLSVRPERGSAAARPDWALADAAVETAFETGARAIVAITASGRTARLISARRPSVPLYAFAPDAAVRRRVSIMWGVVAEPVEPIPDPDLIIEDVSERLRRGRRVRRGDRVIFVFGSPLWGEGTHTNTVRVAVV
jgi:pyruvate kinase